MNIKSVKRKLGMIGATIVLAVTGVGIAAVPASAAVDTFDCFPADCGTGYYYSNEDDPGARFNDNSGQSWGIHWEKDADRIYIRGRLEDTRADGRGATVQVKWHYYNQLSNGKVAEDTTYYEGRATGGKGDVTYYAKDIVTPLFFVAFSDISVRVCNGKSDSGANEHCGAWHGPFHAN